VNSELSRQLTEALVSDRLREAERFRRARIAQVERPDPTDEAVTVRLAREADAGALARLSQLEGRRVPAGPTLVAEVGGVVRAARSLASGASIADPFRPTAHLTELLALRAAHLRAGDSEARPRRRLRAWWRALSTSR
jgi:hypothetical protein